MCTSILQIAQDLTHTFARTMDWDEMRSQPIFVPRNYQWRSLFDHVQHANPYAIIGGGRAHDDEIDLSDGVNEWGLSVQKLTFSNGTRRIDDPTPGKIHLAPFEFSFWMLGHYRSVADIEDHITEIELMASTHALTDYGHPELHFAAVDRTGRCVVIEPTESPMVIRENPLGVVTNSRDYDHQLVQLAKYVTFTPDFIHQTVPLNTPYVTTRQFAGPVPSGGYTVGARFIRAAYNKERADQPTNEQEALVSAWRLLDSVTVPKSLSHRRTYSVYRAATCCESRTYYFEPYHRLSPVRLQLTDAMLHWTNPVFYPVENAPAYLNLNA
ncbi:linear amide C-N hydrolase [Levilactobacillus bambusae]|uniref:Choloylglycine hydrolase n=1 Tax=Levilactobacillus bambusae TaxID=2024736 RepID=A0A2V1MZX7_9LACO|nr:linear amide C-N hydrolase [Levilactobacillus bambusae]PWF99649.1 choloylglycine hydrolase [Levilactobacillus bambusae]